MGKFLIPTGLMVFFGSFVMGLFLFQEPTLKVTKPETLSASAATVVEQSSTASTSATVLFVGDMMFDRYIRTRVAEQGADSVFKDVLPLLAAADFNAGNLEGPVTSNGSVSLGTRVGDITNMRFTFPTTVPALLAKYRFGVVSVGNNHILDFGAAGATETTKRLTESGISYIGDPTGQSVEPIYKEVKGIRLAFVSYNDFLRGDRERTLRAIVMARNVRPDAIIVMAHWGQEYKREPLPRVRVLAQEFSAAGATLIIGTHPHVIGEVEDVGATRTYYSLGNFIFDQYFDPTVRCGLAVEARFAKHSTSTSVTYTDTRVGMHADGSTVLGCD